jgi:2-hydroxy-3-keto-5-methylthiopentenyl-1-phosphate phosphatase
MNIFLDLDNTCIYSIESENYKKKKWMNDFKSHKMENSFVVFERPGLQKFLNWLFKNFSVYVWSSGTKPYVEWIVKNIIENENRKVKKIFHLTHCKKSQKKYGSHNIKKMDLLWDSFDLEDIGPYNTLIIDDLEDVFMNNLKNSIPIKEFITSKKSINDNELESIKKKLIKLKKHYKKHINDEYFDLFQHLHRK